MAVTSERRVVEIKVSSDSRDLKVIADGFARMNRGIKETTDYLRKFESIFFAISSLSFAGIGVREITQTLDSMQKLSDKLNITEGSAIKASERLKDLESVANRNYIAIEDMAQVYSRLNFALSDTGISSDRLINLTDTLQKTFRISGATAAEATGAVIQLSQGLASGQLRGQELRSVLEANVVIGDILAKQLGVTRGQLLKFAEKQGGIKAIEVIQALEKSMGALDEQAAKLKPTIGDAFTQNINSLKINLSDLNKEFGITEIAVKAINFAFNNLDIVAAAVGVAALYKSFILLNGALTVTLGYFATLVASPIVGFLVKAGIAVGGFLASWIGLPVAIAAATASFVIAFSTIDSFRASVIEATKSVAEWIALSFRTPDYKKKYLEQAAAAEELAKKQNQLQRSYVLADNSINGLEKSFRSTLQEMRNGTALIPPFLKSIQDVKEGVFQSTEGVFDFKKSLAALNNQYSTNQITLQKYNVLLKELKIKELNEDWDTGSVDVEAYNKRLKEIQFGKLKTNTKDYQLALKLLNAQFKDNANITAYTQALSNLDMKKVSDDVKEGKANILAFNQEMRGKQIEDWRRQLVLSNEEMNTTKYYANTATIAIDQLNESFRAGKIDVNEYASELIKVEEKFNPNAAFFAGTKAFIDQAGTISQNVANLVTQTFGRLEDAMVEFTKTGKFNFREFTMAVLDDLNRIIIRSLIIRPLAKGILGAIPMAGGDAAGGTTAASSDYIAGNTGGYAKGGAFNNGVEFFARGGVVNSPSMFAHSRGLGVMGEAGPEAIVPLRRDSQGNLGVKAMPSNVTVNVINNAGVETEQREYQGPGGERIIDVLILNKVKEGFAQGSFDKILNSQYNLRRRGA